MEHLRKRLEEELAIALARLRGISVVDTAEPTASAESVFNDADRIQADQAREMTAVERTRLAARVTRLAAAISRMDRGEYGRCVECGGAITEARLSALPDADTCVQCQEQIERRARLGRPPAQEVPAV